MSTVLQLFVSIDPAIPHQIIPGQACSECRAHAYAITLKTYPASSTPARLSRLEHYDALAIGPFILSKVSGRTCTRNTRPHNDNVSLGGQVFRCTMADKILVWLAMPEGVGRRGRRKGSAFLSHDANVDGCMWIRLENCGLEVD